MDALGEALQSLAGFLWGPPLIVLVVGGGLFFLIYSRMGPYRYFGHAIAILRGKYDDVDDPGDISHLQALSAALSGTLGLGNIAGVAVAIGTGGPGAVFWMWVTAVVGVATKFFTCSLSIMYRGRDSRGQLQGGPMYIIREGLGSRWHWLAVFFCVVGLFGTLPIVQVNQLTETLREVVFIPAELVDPDDHFLFDLIFGITVAAIVASVIFGGIKRVGYVAARLVPAMVAVYLLLTAVVLAAHLPELPGHLAFIVTDAFTAQSIGGGVLGMITIGVMRGAFSNEAGIGTEVMAHGAAKTREPVREGLVAMMGPVIDTLIVCTCTALVILVTGVWQEEGLGGASMTAQAFGEVLPYGLGAYIIAFVVLIFASSTMFTFWYYGAKCLGFLIGAERQHYYKYFYTLLVVLGAVVSLEAVFGLIDSMYALMAIPTMTATLLLAPRVMEAARDYFARLREEEKEG
ncbi:AGCS family alanine or glycine:cation symporter [Natronospira proteinivora]|uniref:AGCS family alanine or glycine:cation symporter n=1 Tax=Natronospira proteinivora TaxID=1807133 RepID=A0ABT1G9M3_9GAMM|nr:alanine/glycine:cation symporter family protein [Natronospira proteinivora]MCP1728016.1 AGCS family alanine or glycine:cation symporter [Natronospira proteinivora]